MKKVSIPLNLARRIALNAQLLDGRTKLPDGKEGIFQAIEKLGYIQIDTIAVIRRAHHHILWTRRPDYTPDMLHELQVQDRRVFEYWGHAASYLPMSDFRYYLPRKRSYKDPRSKWENDRLEKYGHLMEPVLDRIRKEGPLASKDFDPPPGTKRGTWWDWKPSKIALEMLFWRGELMITERNNFQKVYDLTERVLPEDVDTRMPEDCELGRFLVRRALGAHGVVQEKEIFAHINAASRKVVTQALNDLMDANKVIVVKIEGLDDLDFYAFPEVIETAATLGGQSPCLFLLSPFDNLIIQRDRIERLFGFAYSLECYLPIAKRKFGYFALPMLWGERFVGRIDIKADHNQKRLLVRNLEFEPELSCFDDLLQSLTQSLRYFSHFNQCESIEVHKTTPEWIRTNLQNQILLLT